MYIHIVIQSLSFTFAHMHLHVHLNTFMCTHPHNLSHLHTFAHTHKLSALIVLNLSVIDYYQVKDGQGEQQVVEDPVNLLTREGPHGDAVAENPDASSQENEEALEDPLEVVLRRDLAPPGPRVLGQVPGVIHRP